MAVISLTTIPQRLQHIEPVLDSLIAQNLPVHLWLPRFARGRSLDTLPPFLNKVIYHIVDDLGPLTKLVYALDLDTQQVITADDDTIYGPGWAAALMIWADSYPGAIITYRGRIWAPGTSYRASRVVSNPMWATRVNLITGCNGTLYPRGAIDKDLLYQKRNLCPTNDDLVISASTAAPIYVVPRKCTLGKHIPARRHAIGTVNRKGLNDVGLKQLWPQ